MFNQQAAAAAAAAAGGQGGNGNGGGVDRVPALQEKVRVLFIFLGF